MGILKGDVEEVQVVEEKGIEMITDIIISIFVRLPVKSLLRFKCVSKFWYNLIISPQFIKMHFNHTHTQNNNPIILLRSNDRKRLYTLSYTGSASSPIIEAKESDYPYQTVNSTFIIWGSCNGLLLITVSTPYEYICLCNPSMKHFTNLPVDFDHIGFDVPATSTANRMITYGFGFNRTMDEYKVIRLDAINTIDKRFVSLVNVFTGCRWRCVGPLPYGWPTQILKPGVHVNGALHWIINMSSKLQTPCHRIFTFDIGEEEYIDVPKPHCVDTVPNPYVCVLSGRLSILINNDETKVRHQVDVWMMMNYAVEESWTKLITITQSSLSYFPRVLWLCKNGEVLTDIPLGNTYVYDLKSNQAMAISECVPNFHFVGTYAESLVCTHSCTYTTGQWKRSIIF